MRRRLILTCSDGAAQADKGLDDAGGEAAVLREVLHWRGEGCAAHELQAKEGNHGCDDEGSRQRQHRRRHNGLCGEEVDEHLGTAEHHAANQQRGAQADALRDRAP